MSGEQSVQSVQSCANVYLNPRKAATTSGVKTLTSWLWVNKPSASILGTREKHVNLGDSVTIVCELRDSLVTPQFVFWYHDLNMVNFQPGVRVETRLVGQDQDSLWVAPPNTTVSRLTISQTTSQHAGNYTCAPHNMVHDSIRLSISKGEDSYIKRQKNKSKDLERSGKINQNEAK